MDNANPDLLIQNGVLIRCDGTEENVTIPEGVVAVGESAFFLDRGLKSIVFPSTMVEIRENAFSGCSNLVTVALNEGLRKIGEKAFFACGFPQITIPESVEYVGESAFTSPLNGELTIFCKKGSAADQYAKANGISSVDNTVIEPDEYPGWGKTLTHAYQAGFSADEKTVFIPAGIETVSSCFEHDLMIETVIFPDSIKRISRDAFARCYNLRSVRFPHGLREIGRSAFYHCALTEAVLPDSVEIIGEEAFKSCRIKKLRLPSGLKEIGKESFFGNDLSGFIFPETLERIGEKAFAFSRRSADVVLPEGLLRVGDGAFEWSNFWSIRIPGEKTVFDGAAFRKCRGTVLYIRHDLPGITSETFNDSNGVTVITESRKLAERLEGTEDLAVITASCDEAYDTARHLAEGETVPIEMLHIDNPAYRLLKTSRILSINRLLEIPETELPEEVFLGKQLKNEIVETVDELKEKLARQ